MECAQPFQGTMYTLIHSYGHYSIANLHVLGQREVAGESKTRVNPMRHSTQTITWAQDQTMDLGAVRQQCYPLYHCALTMNKTHSTLTSVCWKIHVYLYSNFLYFLYLNNCSYLFCHSARMFMCVSITILSVSGSCLYMWSSHGLPSKTSKAALLGRGLCGDRYIPLSHSHTQYSNGNICLVFTMNPLRQ